MRWRRWFGRKIGVRAGVAGFEWARRIKEDAMGIRNYLIEGVSGSGKTSVAEELQRRGYHVIHGDRVLAYHGDPQTGARLEPPRGPGVADSAAWVNAHWIWPVDTVRSLVADQGEAITFFCGASRNSRHFIDLFDAVFVLEIDAQTLTRRLVGRPEDEFGGLPAERALVMQLHATKENIPERGTAIDATAPLARVVDDILARSGEAGRGSSS
ncbi:MAG: adenylate kinase family enzyme [Devosia sp.]|jgi:adenylate kinase family enzyme|tara:strand:- start:52405 stop:53040 length:636 start_codon:yes stop_codon:yes gene_type:complete